MLVKTEDLNADLLRALGEPQVHQTYCGLDCCVTFEVLQALQNLTQNEEPLLYSFERALQAPALDMMLRGFKIDEYERARGIERTRAELVVIREQLDELASAVWSRGLNPSSPKQLKAFFYEAMRLPEQWSSFRGERKLSLNRETLEKLEVYLHARPFVALILEARDLAKRLSVLETEISHDGRMRTSYNIGGTNTGRWSSSSDVTGTGTNLQNITPELRRMFVADAGWKLCGIDLEQAESREVGWLCGTLFGDWRYLDACECLTGDHQVLTPTGWQNISEKPEVIAQWNEGEIQFSPVATWHEGLTTSLISAENESIFVLGTPNHKMPVLAGKYNNKLSGRTLTEIKNAPNYRAPLTGRFRRGKTHVEYAALLAAFQADGTRVNNQVHWTFAKSRKIKMMRELLTSLGYKFSEYLLGAGTTRFYLHQGQGQDLWKKECSAEILDWDEQSLQKFCESHKHWDGSFEVHNVRITAKSIEHLKWLATAYFLCGYSTNINSHKEIYYSLTIKARTTTQYRSAVIKEHNIAAQVYCPTTQTGYFVVRRNGRIFISGNSGDLHTTTAKLIWPDRGWTGKVKDDRQLADTKFYREFSYRDMSKRGGHGCLTGEHEVLTRTGWVPIHTMPEQEILTWSLEGSFFQRPSRWTSFPYNGKLISLEGRSLSVTMTTQHRVPVHKDPYCRLHWIAAEELPIRGQIPLGSKYVGGNENISPALARLVAAYQCDGYQKSANRLEFHFHKERKFTRLMQLAEACALPWKRAGECISVITWMKWSKFAGSYLLNWPTEALLAYIDEHKYWDGHISATAQCLFSVNREHLEWLQTIGRLVGIGGNFQKPRISGFGSLVHKLQQNKRQFADISSLEKIEREAFYETVYCPTVSTGAFYVRRGGKISITGNSNYLGTPFTMARHLKVPTKVMENFQSAYFAAFPSIPRWHRWVAERLQTTGKLTTPFGRSRQFFGRPNDDATLRKAIAFSPQSSTGDRLNLGLWRIWKSMPDTQLLAQVHDAVYYQYPDTGNPEIEASYVRRGLKAVEIALAHNGRQFIIPGEAKIGYNWAAKDNGPKTGPKGERLWRFEDGNPEGLKKWDARQLDTRKRSAQGKERLL